MSHANTKDSYSFKVHLVSHAVIPDLHVSTTGKKAIWCRIYAAVRIGSI